MKTQRRVENSESKTTLKAPVSHSLFFLSLLIHFSSANHVSGNLHVRKRTTSRGSFPGRASPRKAESSA